MRGEPARGGRSVRRTAAGRRSSLALALAALAALELVACATSHASSQPVSSPTTGDELFSIACDSSPNECLAEAKRRCPGGHRTVEAGRSGWYADDEEPFAPAAVLEERRNYKQEGWVVACHR